MTSKSAVAFFPGRGVELIAPPDHGVLRAGDVFVETELVGFCGTDREIVHGGVAVHPEEGWIILGHEMVGTVSAIAAGPDGFEPGDRVVSLVRLPCNVCAPCLAGRSDFCLSGRYQEYGITKLHGFARPSVQIPSYALVKVPDGLGDLAVLAEPLSIVEKAIEQARLVMGRIPGRSLDSMKWGEGMGALVTGAGSIGLLTCYLLAELGFEVEVVDIRGPESLAAHLASAAGAAYIQVARDESPETFVDLVRPADLIVEASGSPNLAVTLLGSLTPGGVLVWVGVAAEEHIVKIDATKTVLNAVLKHNAVIGTVNSSRLHFEHALKDLLTLSERSRFGELLTSVLPIDRFEDAIWPKGEAIKQAISYKDVK